MQSVSERDLDVATPPVADSPSPELSVVVAATYTAEPIEGPLAFWLKELGFEGRVEFAPYNQILQQLFDPSSEFGRNAGGINVILVRPEDWARYKPGGWDDTAIRAGAEELGNALRSFAERSGTPTIIVAPPPSPSVTDHPSRLQLLSELEGRLQADVLPYDSLHWVGHEEIAPYLVDSFFDEAGDRVGHIPYTPLATASLATAIARRIHAIKSPPYKVIALDCDNTLWKGVVGEDGPHGIILGPGMKALHEFVVAQQADGMVVCLVSKNVEADVLEAFELRDDFPLRRDHLVSWRISWEPKSVAIAELAAELNLGLDSFIFLDDNPVECAEVRSALPQVLTIQVPTDEGIVDLLRHTWAFDRLKVTEEDRKRTIMYRLNADRTRMESQAADIGAFLASLDLKVDIASPSDDQWARVSQLTQRTNQFNFSTRRRTETEARQLERSGLECLRVEVSDRFGEYGLVGVAIFGASDDSLDVDTMLLSCRVLGRGVEHAMFAHLGNIAMSRGLDFVEVHFIPSPKNEPAAKFLDSLAGATSAPATEGGTLYRLPARLASELAYRPGEDAREQLELARTGGKTKPKGEATNGPKVRDKSLSYTRIATELLRPEAVLQAVDAASMIGRSLAAPYAPPSTAIERQLCGLWCRVLHVDRVGIRDAFTDLGGTSLKAARLFVEIESQFGIRLPMTTLLDAPTVEGLAARMTAAGRGETRKSLRLLRRGVEGGPVLFLVHDGDGEVLLYLNLARRLPEDVSVYGLEPRGNDRCPTILTTIPEMAAYYVTRALEACPSGPLLLGGMCAGGTIAFEMAMQLENSGHPVALVLLLDASDANAEFRPNLHSGRRWRSFLQSIRGAGSAELPACPGEETTGKSPVALPGSKLVRLARRASKVASKIRNVAAYEIGSRLQKREDAGRVHALRAAVRGGETPVDLVGPTFRTVYKQAEREFLPRGRLEAPVLLIRAGGDGLDYPGDEPLARIYKEPLLGWADRVAEGPESIEVVDVPGGHGGMLQEPHVVAIVEPLRAAIDRAVAAEVGR